MWSNLFFWSWFLSFQIVSHPLYLLPQFKEDWKEKVFPLMDFFFTLFEQMWTKDKCTFCADVETFIHTTFFLRQHMARIFQGFSLFFLLLFNETSKMILEKVFWSSFEIFLASIFFFFSFWSCQWRSSLCKLLKRFPPSRPPLNATAFWKLESSLLDCYLV